MTVYTDLRPLTLTKRWIDRATPAQIERGKIHIHPSRYNLLHWYVALTAKVHHPAEQGVVLAEARVETEEEARLIEASIKDICLLAKGGET